MFESLNELVLSAIVVLSGGILAVLIGKWLGRQTSVSVLLYAWHTVLGYLFSSYVLTNGGDAWDYYQHARFDYVEPNLGTEFIAWATSIPVSMGLTYWPLSFLYNTAGASGLILFCSALQESTAGHRRDLFTRLLVLVCVAIPSLSFWTAGIGKDSVAFLSVGLFLWATLAFDRRKAAAVLAVVIMFPVRPHIAVLMVISVGLGTLFVRELRTSVRLGMGAISAAAAVFVVPLALIYSGTSRFSTIAEYISDRQVQNLEGGSSIDIASMNPALRLFSYFYRPLPGETAGIDQFAASIDNLILIALTAIGLIAILRVGFIRVFRTYSISLLYGLGCLLLLSQVTANLGLAMRQKWMMAPALMLVFMGAWSQSRESAASRGRRLSRLPGTPQAVR